MDAIIIVAAFVFMFAFIAFLIRLFSALFAGRCSECGNFWTTSGEKSSHDDHRPGGRYVYHQYECGKCNHVWGKTTPKFVPDKKTTLGNM